eukprot:TRINITY_DN8688_c0_g1_i2.p1 TRINITY_DN8688_c0_g1~~TRINITY_DN8688_c0_g1_i2.p1  ORF type:complete len:811 (-),score=161.63 TRINITY_DN8688_c0_g1_i2:34-2466(-)
MITKELKGHTGAILTAEYVDSLKGSYLVTSSTDNSLIFWDANSGWRQRGSIQEQQPLLSLHYEPSANESLFAGSSWGTILVFDPFKRKTIAKLEEHTDATMSIISIVNTPFIASSSLDARVIIWDPSTSKYVQRHKIHQKGVLSLAYSPELKLIFSAGFDRDVGIIAPMSGEVGRLKGHHSSLIGVEAIDGYHVVSADQDNIFKLWDVRINKCLQTFSPTSPQTSLCSFCWVPKTKRIVASSSRLYSFEYDKAGTPWLTDDFPFVTVLYNSASLTIATVSSKQIKIWDAVTGCLLNKFTGFQREGDITAACLDKRQRKMFVGMGDGNTLVVNYSNGAVLKVLTKHSAEVSSVCMCDLTTTFTSSWDGTLVLHDDNLEDQPTSISKSYQSISDGSVGKDITMATYSPELHVLAASTVSRYVRIWEKDSTTFEAQLKPHTAEVTCMHFLAPYPLLATADALGHVSISTVRPAPIRNRIVFSFLNQLPGKSLPSVVHALSFDPLQKILITGDDNGDITCWRISNLLETLLIQEIDTGVNAIKLTASQVKQVEKLIDKLDESSVEIFKTWKAHDGAIKTLTYVPLNPQSLLSAGADKQVKSWNLVTNQNLGCLCQGKASRWALPVDAKSLIDKENLAVDKLMNELQEVKDVTVKRKPNDASDPLDLSTEKKEGVQQSPFSILYANSNSFRDLIPISEHISKRETMKKRINEVKTMKEKMLQDFSGEATFEEAACKLKQSDMPPIVVNDGAAMPIASAPQLPQSFVKIGRNAYSDTERVENESSFMMMKGETEKHSLTNDQLKAAQKLSKLLGSL